MPEDNNQTDAQFDRIVKDSMRNFRRNIKPELERREQFSSKGDRKRERHRKAVKTNRQPTISFSPLAQTLRADLSPEISIPNPFGEYAHTTVKLDEPAPVPFIRTVFIILEFRTSPPVVHLQKIAKKPQIGFPSGTIFEGQTFLDVAVNTIRQDTGPNNEGLDIGQHDLIDRGVFPLLFASDGAQGKIVHILLPAGEKDKIRVGGSPGDPANQVTQVLLKTKAEIRQMAEDDELLGNSITVFKIMEPYLL